MPSPFKTLTDVRRANKALGHHWFDDATTRSFDSRFKSEMLIHGRFFICSEQYHVPDRYSRQTGTTEPGFDAPRQYSIRRVEDDGAVRTLEEEGSISNLNSFTTYQAAYAVAVTLADDARSFTPSADRAAQEA